MVKTIESLITEMKTPLFDSNTTRMIDYKVDAHLSLSRNTNMIEETSHIKIVAIDVFMVFLTCGMN